VKHTPRIASHNPGRLKEVEEPNERAFWFPKTIVEAMEVVISKAAK
jgi:hypothetical protein